MPITAASSIAEDWQTCKQAHTDALQMQDAQGKWRPDTVKPWLNDLADKAGHFKSKHGVEFDPSKPITQQEAA
jgi:hypothetical protein